uniref:Uncharacterized protein n=1 Tax=Tanacetum cinerariifolium TaxID=118510 RepID=A0A6L2LI17_TANCI|nr:hypothetical protein [Tanacetum cinerariifolium]
MQMLCKLSNKARKPAEDSQLLKAQVKELVGYQGSPMSPQSSLLPQVKDLKKHDTDDDKSIDLEMTDDEETDDEVLQGDAEISNVGKADAEKTEEAKDESNKAELPPTSSSLSISSSFVLTPVQESPSAAPVITLPTPFISTIPLAPLQQTTTPIPSPLIITDAPTITTVVPESNALFVVQLRVEK